MVWSFTFLGDRFWIISEVASPPEQGSFVHGAVHIPRGTSCPLVNQHYANLQARWKKSLKRLLRYIVIKHQDTNLGSGNAQEVNSWSVGIVFWGGISTCLPHSLVPWALLLITAENKTLENIRIFLIRCGWSTAFMLYITKSVCKQKSKTQKWAANAFATHAV